MIYNFFYFSGLVHLLSNHNQYVVAESVVVIKKLLQSQDTEQHKQRIITQMSKLLDFITVPAARASILWLIGEYNEHVPKIAPDVLRKMAKSFCDEETSVKLQVLNLAVKLILNNPQQTTLLTQHVFNLARYDANYDVRDRARFLKPFTTGDERASILMRNAKKIFLATKPAPQIENRYTGRENFQLGTMSHYLNNRVNRYQDLPDFPTTIPDTSARNVESPGDVKPEDVKMKTVQKAKNHQGKKNAKSFYSESDDDSSSSSSSDSSSESESDGGKPQNGETKKQNNVESEDSESSSSSDESESGSEESALEVNHKPAENPKSAAKSNLDLLLDLEEATSVGQVMTPSLGGFLTPMSSSATVANRIELVGPSFIAMDKMELLNKVNGYGLGVTYKYSRSPHLFSSNMVSIELQFTNHGNVELTDIQVGAKNLTSGMSLNEFAQISQLAPKQTLMGVIGIDFCDSSQAANFEIRSSVGVSKVSIKPSVGELVRSVTLPEPMFKEERNKLRGMSESSCKATLRVEFRDSRQLKSKIFEVANLASITHGESNDLLLFAGQTLGSKSLVLVSIAIQDETGVAVTVNCEKLVIGSILMNEIKDSIKTI